MYALYSLPLTSLVSRCHVAFEMVFYFQSDDETAPRIFIRKIEAHDRRHT